MREDDLERIRESMGRGESLRTALGLQVPFAEMLGEFLAKELGQEDSFGLPWLSADSIAVKVLVSDFLLSAVSSSVDNLAQARLHLLEAREAFGYLDSTVRYTIAFTPRAPAGPPSADESVATERVDIHAAGLLRAIGSALDCIGIATIGLAALPTDIRKGGFGTARGLLQVHGTALPTDLRSRLETAVDRAGPEGWLDWALQMRNTLVHRPQRIQVWHIPNMGRARRRRVLLLPRHPTKSDVEAFRDLRSPEAALLHEHAEDVLGGVLTSTQALIDEIAKALYELAVARKQNPAVLNQPEVQWPRETTQESPFRGYGGAGVQPGRDSQLLMAPATVRRMKAASVMGSEALRRWRRFWGE